MAPPESKRVRNLLLNALPAQEQRALIAQAEFVELPRRALLELPNKKIEKVYFVESGIVSIVANGAKGGQVEVGIIGREGITGLAVIHGADRLPYSSYMQVAGTAYSAPATAIRDAMKRSAECQRVFANFAQAFTLQIAETAVANAQARIEERLARWLLMAQDRVGKETIPLTHEFLSLMMGARRASVTEAIHAAARKGLVTHARATIVISDRAGLEASAGRYYGLPEREYRRLFHKVS